MPSGAASAGAYETLVANRLASGEVNELWLDFVTGDATPGSLVQLTQNFYVKQIDETAARIHTKLDVDRSVLVEGRLSLSRTVGSTGRSEIFGHHRYTVLAYLEAVEQSISIRPL